MTSEVTNDLKFELSGLNNLWSSVILASKWLYLTNLARIRSQLSSIDLRARTSPQVKIKHDLSDISLQQFSGSNYQFFSPPRKKYKSAVPIIQPEVANYCMTFEGYLHPGFCSFEFCFVRACIWTFSLSISWFLAARMRVHKRSA